MPQEELLFPRSENCQLRSEGCPAKAEGRGWTFRPRLDIQTKAGSQTKEMKVPLKAWKVGLKVFNSWKHSNDALGILFFWGRGLDLSLRSELQHFENSLKVSRSSTENSRPKACYFPITIIIYFNTRILALNFWAYRGIGPSDREAIAVYK